MSNLYLTEEGEDIFTKVNKISTRSTMGESGIQYIKEEGFSWIQPIYIEEEEEEEEEEEAPPPATKQIESSSGSRSLEPKTQPITDPPYKKFQYSSTSSGSRTTSSLESSSSGGRMTETTSSPPTTSPANGGEKKLKRQWSIQEDIAILYASALAYALPSASYTISPCPLQDDADYMSTTAFEAWPDYRKTGRYLGPTEAALTVSRTTKNNDWDGMMETPFLYGPGFLMFKLSMKWISMSVHKMVKDGMDICAPRLYVERAILYFSENIPNKMHAGHLQSTVIGETLARILEYSRVEVIRKFHQEDVHQAILSEDLAALRHALNVVKADRILHVADVGQQYRFEMCISAAEQAGWIVNDRCPHPLSHVGFCPVQADDYGSQQTHSSTVGYLVNLLGKSKIRCKALLLEEGTADEWTAEELEDTAEALGYDAVKYAVLKNNRLTKCTINLDEILNLKGNTVVYLYYTHAQICSISTEYRRDIKKLKKLKGEKVEELILKNNEERELGLHLLRFTEVLEEVCTLLMPHILCEYLYSLCKKFDSFVSQVVRFHDERSKLMLCEATSKVMRKCFHLLAFTPIQNTILKLLRPGSQLSKRFYCSDLTEQHLLTSTPIHNKILKLLRPGSQLFKRFYCSDLTEQQLMELFCKGPCFRFDLCNVLLTHNIDDGVEIRGSLSPHDNKLFLFGTIQAETNILDPSHYGSFNIFNRNFENPLLITEAGSFSPHDICYCSLSVSTFVKITAKLYGTTYYYKGDRMENYIEYRDRYPPTASDNKKLEDALMYLLNHTIPTRKKKKKTEKVDLDNDAFDICAEYVIINLSKHFANGGSGCCKLKGKDGYLDLYYVALKYAVEAALEVDFVATSKETKVFGTVVAYYGKNFCYASDRHLYDATLFEIKEHSHIEPGKMKLMRSAVGVPAQYSLIIKAELHDFTSGDKILSGVCEFFVPVDGSSSFDSINGDDCSLKLKVDWKLPV